MTAQQSVKEFQKVLAQIVFLNSYMILYAEVRIA